MENATCHVILVDRCVREDRVIHVSAKDGTAASEMEMETPLLKENVNLLLDIFGDVNLVSTGAACLTKLLELQDTARVELKPVLILLDVPLEETLVNSPSSPQSPYRVSALELDGSAPGDEEAQNGEDELYGLALVQRIVSESYMRNLSKLVLAVPLIIIPPELSADDNDTAAEADCEDYNGVLLSCNSETRRARNRRLLRRCLDLGATDVMSSPMNAKCITNLEVHAYRAYRDAAREQKSMLEVRKGRKRSWVGIHEEKPFSYLREAMVAGLMNGICRIGDGLDDRLSNARVYVSPERQAEVAAAVGQWHFCAHDFSEDELIVAAAVMFRHALALPELEQWRIPPDQLNTYLLSCRAAYNDFVPYHNFRHVVDVLQATFHFLVQIGALQVYPAVNAQNTNSSLQTPPMSPTPAIAARSPLASLLGPVEALTLLITAIGHDVGHPGVNNGFLVTLNAPLAQLYNDRSVLESFHCAAYSQILRRHWPAAFSDSGMRNLMISSILATDMGLHFDYMKKMGDLQEKLHVSNTTDGWDGRMIKEQKALACSLLIKCADICNVARRHDTALQWMHILADEFSRQASMEKELSIQSSLYAAPTQETIASFKAQLGFMNMFAIPLFQGVADLLPAMRYTVNELDKNKSLFEEGIAAEQRKQDPAKRMIQRDGTFSPRTMSFAVPPETRQEQVSMAGDQPPTTAAGKTSPAREFTPQTASPVNKIAPLPALPGEYKEVSGNVGNLAAVADYANSEQLSSGESTLGHPFKQRHSEATEESTSAPLTGDWASQATSATTGKMPLSPSTQGTSIVSRDSLDRPGSVPATITTVSDSAATRDRHVMTPKVESLSTMVSPVDEEISLQSTEFTTTSGSDKSLKKRPSRFRMNALNLFRRHKGASPPMPAADTAR